ncbi:MAG: hypothetical protein BZ138_07705 [Methanosphaera sp. rholeuAM270]|nr:MAG: hypothetical protein BZ138_07705 [Methanosphaera sp. rholeuAM270]
MEKTTKNDIKTFAEKHSIEERLVRNYIDCLEIGDNNGVDVYYSMILENCLNNLQKDFETELREFTKSYFQHK